MPLSTLTSKGQVTIPKGVRETMQIYSGDKVEFILNEDNEVVIKPITKKVADVFGQLSKYKKKAPVSIDEMNEAVAKQLEKDFS